MPLSDLFIEAGLGLDMVGVLMIWKYGIPSELRTGGTGFWQKAGTDEDEKRKEERYWWFERLGLAALLLGFSLQILGQALPHL